MDHPIPTRKPDLMSINKKKSICHLVDFFYFSKPYCKNERKQKVKHRLGSCQRAEKTVDHEIEGDAHGKETRGRLETRGRTETIAQQKSARIFRRVLET